MKEFIQRNSSIYTISSVRLSRLSYRAPRAAGNLGFHIKQNATNGTRQFFLVVCRTHIVCCNFHSKKNDLS